MPGQFHLQVDLTRFDEWDLKSWKESVLTAPDAQTFWQEVSPDTTFDAFDPRWDYRSPEVPLEGNGIASSTSCTASTSGTSVRRCTCICRAR
ncbi:MAG: hypothetical protein CBARDCOR_6737 [uncultured Caballeronia sp.]|nr:MAG: hypothetical protein CBARDCOR_6737 [uncultured Caballeronia sp.]